MKTKSFYMAVYEGYYPISHFLTLKASNPILAAMSLCPK